jgi:transposase
MPGSGERAGETTVREGGTAPRPDSYYWAADVLAELGANTHLAHPLGNNWGNRRVKNDERDAADLVDLLRLGRLAEAYIAPPPVRELRELVRHRAKLVALRSNLKAQTHAVLAKEGLSVPVTDLFGLAGRRWPDRPTWPLPTAAGSAPCSSSSSISTPR